MEIKDVNYKWSEIKNFTDIKGFKALRISSDCVPDLFLGIDEEGYRCLLLYLPANIRVKLKGSDKERIKIGFIKSKNIILIKLTDNDFKDLFNDLIVSLYSKINNISDPDIYARELVYSFYKWSDLFENKRKSKLSFEEVMGLFGELFVLIGLLKESDVKSINLILESWQGLYNNTNDFVFDNKNIEIKAKEDSKPFVKISSEYQLNDQADKELELLVVSLKIDLMKGESIHDLLVKLIHNIRTNTADVSILYRALSQKGLTIDSTKEYDNHRFLVVKTNLYNCLMDGFPRLSLSNIPEEISRLRYYLRVSGLKKYLIEEKLY